MLYGISYRVCFDVIYGDDGSATYYDDSGAITYVAPGGASQTFTPPPSPTPEAPASAPPPAAPPPPVQSTSPPPSAGAQTPPPAVDNSANNTPAASPNPPPTATSEIETFRSMYPTASEEQLKEMAKVAQENITKHEQQQRQAAEEASRQAEEGNRQAEEAAKKAQEEYQNNPDNYVWLPDKKGVDKKVFEKLDEKYQEVGRKQGFDAMAKAIEDDNAAAQKAYLDESLKQAVAAAHNSEWKPDFNKVIVVDGKEISLAFEGATKEYIEKVKEESLLDPEHPLPDFTGKVANRDKGTVFDETGTEVSAEEFNKRLPEIQAKAQAFSEALMAKDKIKLADDANVVPQTGETYKTEGKWISKEAFSMLDPKYQEIGKTKGFDAMNKAINDDIESQQKALEKLDKYQVVNKLPEGIAGPPTTGYEINKFLRENPDNTDTLLKAGFNKEDVEKAQAEAKAIREYTQSLGESIANRQFNKYDAIGLDRALHQAGYKFTDDKGQYQSSRTIWQNASEGEKQKIAEIYSNDPNNNNAFASAIASLNMVASEHPFTIGLITAPISVIGTPIAKATTGQEVSKVEILSAAGMAALLALSAGGAGVLTSVAGRAGSIVGRAAETGISAGFAGGSIKNTVDVFKNPESTVADKRVAIVYDALMIVGTSFAAAGLKSAVTKKAPSEAPGSASKAGKAVKDTRPVAEKVAYNVAAKVEDIKAAVTSPLKQAGLKPSEIKQIVNDLKKAGISEEAVSALSDSKVKNAITQKLPEIMDAALEKGNRGLDRAIKAVQDAPKNTAKAILKNVKDGVYTVTELPNKAFEKTASKVDTVIAKGEVKLGNASEALSKAPGKGAEVAKTGLKTTGRTVEKALDLPNKAFEKAAARADVGIETAGRKMGNVSEGISKASERGIETTKTGIKVSKAAVEKALDAPNKLFEKSATKSDTAISKADASLGDLSEVLSNASGKGLKALKKGAKSAGLKAENILDKPNSAFTRAATKFDRNLARLEAEIEKADDALENIRESTPQRIKSAAEAARTGTENALDMPNKAFENSATKLDSLLAKEYSLKTAADILHLNEIKVGTKQARVDSMVRNLKDLNHQFSNINYVLKSIEKLNRTEKLNAGDIKALSDLKEYYVNKANELVLKRKIDFGSLKDIETDIVGKEKELVNAKDIRNSTDNPRIKKILDDNIKQREADLHKSRQRLVDTKKLATKTKLDLPLEKTETLEEKMKGAEPAIKEEKSKALENINKKSERGGKTSPVNPNKISPKPLPIPNRQGKLSNVGIGSGGVAPVRKSGLVPGKENNTKNVPAVIPGNINKNKPSESTMSQPENKVKTNPEENTRTVTMPEPAPSTEPEPTPKTPPSPTPVPTPRPTPKPTPTPEKSTAPKIPTKGEKNLLSIESHPLNQKGRTDRTDWPDGTIVWNQGQLDFDNKKNIVHHISPPPYEDEYTSFEMPKGMKNAGLTSPKETIQALGGKVKKDADFEVGFSIAHVRKGGSEIGFSANPKFVIKANLRRRAELLKSQGLSKGKFNLPGPVKRTTPKPQPVRMVEMHRTRNGGLTRRSDR